MNETNGLLTSPGLSDLWAQHGCHRSSVRSPLGMFMYIQTPHPLSLPLPLSVPFASLLFFSLWPSAVRPAARGLGEQGRGGEWKEKGVVKEEEKEEELSPFFFFHPLRTRPVASTPLCCIIHSGVSAWGGWRRRRFFWGGSPTGSARVWPVNRCLILSVIFCNDCSLLSHHNLHVKKGGSDRMERGVFIWQVSPPSHIIKL